MKRKSYFRWVFVLSYLTLLFFGCQKGDAGPAGPAGPTGPQGPKGDSASSDVIYSSWLDVTYTADTIHIGSIVDTIGYYTDITAAKLSSSIISSGEVKVYMNLGTSDSADVVPLPYLDVFSGISVSPQFYSQRIALYSNTNTSTLTRSGRKYLQYRYILVPGSVPARWVPPVEHKTIDWANYNEVKTILHLQN